MHNRRSTSPITLLTPLEAAPVMPFVAVPENKAKEWISLAYIEAVTAQAGLNIRQTRWDDGLDMDIGSTKPVVAGFDWRNLWISLQVKATEDWQIKDGAIAFFLKRSNYEQLRSKSLVRQYLVLYTLPQHQQGRSCWVRQEAEHVELRSRAFYLDLSDAPELTSRSNGRQRSGRTVYVPIANRLTACSLRKLYVNAVDAVKAMLNV